jgi:ABC-2 type transport system permease protein
MPMSAVFALIRKQVAESRWLAGLSAAALFGLSWLTVFITARIESRMRELSAGGGEAARGAGFLRGMGGAAMDFSTTAIEMTWWNHPFILLLVCMWGIARGSGAIAGEIERGTMDLTLSRPVPRGVYLAVQVLTALLGFAVLVGGLVAGNLVGSRYNAVASPPSVLVLLRPGLNLAALGFAVYGYTLMLSAFDVVRWRPNLFGSVLTLAGFITLIIANVPQLDDYKWIAKFSIFKAYNPVEAGVKGANLAFNAGLLGGIGLAGVVIAALAFWKRDLPANS